MEQQKEPSQEPPAASCPECGAPRAADNTPSCACGARASDALRDARTAQAAAAEDFDPLRIRPYVELDRAGEPVGPGPAGHADPGSPGGPPAAPPADGLPPAAAEGAGRAPSAAAGSGAGAGTPASAPDATMTLRAVDAGADGPGTATGSPDGNAKAKAVLPTPLAPSAGSPSAHDLRMFETSTTAPLPRTLADGDGADGAPGTDGPAGADGDGRPPRRRRTGLLLGAAGAVVVVMGAAGFASGLFSYDTPSRDGALPTEVRVGVPDPSTGESSPGTAPSTTAAPSARSVPPSPSASASPSQSTSASASPSPSASSASPAPSRPAEPTRATTAPADDAPQESEDDDRDLVAGPTLRRGDQGPEVVELQQRLAGMKMYRGDVNGNFDRQVEDAVRQYQWFRGIYTDGVGVYGPDTRRRLESEPQDS
ncbi:peptidoglycan-binding protein [Streptomyces sp. NPDC048187]|uniref:peptidoglycan-binding domain-containing protein n=1 Tax=Streptomyces sp. NPDC048187 TaxID=3365509 RepID=UPI00371C3D08